MSAHTPAFDAPLPVRTFSRTRAAPSDPSTRPELPDGRRLRVFEVVGEALASFYRNCVRLVIAELVVALLSVAATFALDFVCGLFAQGVAQVGALAPLGVAALLFGKILGTMVSALLAVGYTRFLLEAARGRKPSLSLLFSGRDRVWPMLLVNLVAAVLVLAGTALLVVPGVIAFLASLMTNFVVADRDTSGLEAMRESFRLTRGFRLRLLALSGIGLLLVVLGVLAAYVGAFVALPVIGLVFAHAYLRLTGEAS